MNEAKQLVEFHDFHFGKTESDALELDAYRDRKLYDVNIRYETYGTLNAAGSNAVLILHALTGDAHVSGYHSESDPKPGWWDEMVGPGKPVDTNRYYVVCSNILGGCSGSTGPRSIDPATDMPYNMDFPMITIRDMVRAQKRLMDHLGIKISLGHRRINGRNAGLRVGDHLSRSGRQRNSDCDNRPTFPAKHCI